MTTWLHFIGRGYYKSRRTFEREALEYGVTRRVSLQQLKAMEFGDRVLLAMRDGKSAVVFGEFMIDRLSGLSSEAAAEIAGEFNASAVDSPDVGRKISRGCGSYVIGFVWAVSASLKDLADKIKDCDDRGKPMVGGNFRPRQLVRLKKIPHRQGFRAFDYGSFMEDVALATQYSVDSKHLTAVRSFYYTTADGEATTPEGLIQQVQHYERA